MKKGKKRPKLGRKKDQRKALIRSLTAALFLHGRITTTLIKAKATQPFAERLITHAKKQSLAARRLIESKLPSQAARTLYHEIAPRFVDRPGGYTRILKLAPRTSDTAKRVIFELVEEQDPKPKSKESTSTDKSQSSQHDKQHEKTGKPSKKQ